MDMKNPNRVGKEKYEQNCVSEQILDSYACAKGVCLDKSEGVCYVLQDGDNSDNWRIGKENLTQYCLSDNQYGNYGVEDCSIKACIIFGVC